MAFLSPTASIIFKHKKSSKKTKKSSKNPMKSKKTKKSSIKRISKSNISSPQNTNNVKRYLSDLQEYDAKMKIYNEHMLGHHTYSMLKPKKPNPILPPKYHKYNSRQDKKTPKERSKIRNKLINEKESKIQLRITRTIMNQPFKFIHNV